MGQERDESWDSPLFMQFTMLSFFLSLYYHSFKPSNSILFYSSGLMAQIPRRSFPPFHLSLLSHISLSLSLWKSLSPSLFHSHDGTLSKRDGLLLKLLHRKEITGKMKGKRRSDLKMLPHRKTILEKKGGFIQGEEKKKFLQPTHHSSHFRSHYHEIDRF